jgi:hypothetical protein
MAAERGWAAHWGYRRALTAGTTPAGLTQPFTWVVLRRAR